MSRRDMDQGSLDQLRTRLCVSLGYRIRVESSGIVSGSRNGCLLAFFNDQLYIRPDDGVTSVEVLPLETVADFQKVESPGHGIEKRINFGRPKRALDNSPAPPGVSEKRWTSRRFLFSRFDEGVRLDDESWFSVTPEAIAAHIARRCSCDVIFDAFAGAGGNSIQFAYTSRTVVSVEIDPARLNLAKHNERIYHGNRNLISWIIGDCVSILEAMKEESVDIVFLSPPWGGPGYQSKSDFNLIEDVAIPTTGSTCNGVKIFKLARRVARRGVAYFLPRNTRLESLVEVLGEAPAVFETHHVGGGSDIFTVCAYFGDFC